jgi:hypothetical protein
MKQNVIILSAALLLPGCGADAGHPGVVAVNGLEWLVGPDSCTTWSEAEQWVAALGEGWRIPTVAELEALYEAGITSTDWGPLQNTGRWVWASDEAEPGHAWHFEFDYGAGFWYFRELSYGRRAFAVREP